MKPWNVTSYTSSIPQIVKTKLSNDTGKAIKKIIEYDIKPLDIINKKSIENAITLVVALGGSTNAVLHFLAIAKAAKVGTTIFKELAIKPHSLQI